MLARRFLRTLLFICSCGSRSQQTTGCGWRWSRAGVAIPAAAVDMGSVVANINVAVDVDVLPPINLATCSSSELESLIVIDSRTSVLLPPSRAVAGSLVSILLYGCAVSPGAGRTFCHAVRAEDLLHAGEEIWRRILDGAEGAGTQKQRSQALLKLQTLPIVNEVVVNRTVLPLVLFADATALLQESLRLEPCLATGCKESRHASSANPGMWHHVSYDIACCVKGLLARLHAPTAAAERSALNKAAKLCMRMCGLCGDVGACKIDDDGEGKPIVICQNDPYCRQSPRYDRAVTAAIPHRCVACRAWMWNYVASLHFMISHIS